MDNIRQRFIDIFAESIVEKIIFCGVEVVDMPVSIDSDGNEARQLISMKIPRKKHQQKQIWRG